MSDIPTITPEFEVDLLAAEYVIGLLDLAERTAAGIRLGRDTGFADRVADWEERLSGLNDDYAEVAAPNLMPAIEQRLFPQPSRVSRGLFGNLWAWGSAAAAALAVVAYLALTPAAPSLTATLAAETGLRYEAVVTQDKLTITRVAGSAPDATHSYELWIIAGDDPPRSLGVIPGDAETISLPGVAAGQTLAISLEPLGGSPNGSPTTVLATGQLTDA
jgi:anti-sigma-K factor RskA